MSERTLPPTPSQTIGPFFGFALDWQDGPEVVAADAPGAIEISGLVLDGRGAPVPDAMLEIWGADAAGHFDGAEGATFRGFGRCPTDADGRYRFRTVKPGPTAWHDGGRQAPHVAVSVFARGLLARLVTRIYFADEEDRNAADPVLAHLGEAREGLLAAPVPGGYRFDIHLQGEGETPFFSI